VRGVGGVNGVTGRADGWSPCAAAGAPASGDESVGGAAVSAVAGVTGGAIAAAGGVTETSRNGVGAGAAGADALSTASRAPLGWA